MKINELLNESSNQYSDEKLFEIILNSEFYNDNKDILDSRTALFRGINSKVSTNTIHEFQFRKKPLDSSVLIHNLTNELSKKEFGLPIRNLMFGTTDDDVAGGYGKIYTLFPIGKYELYYHPQIGDFLTTVANEDRLHSVIIESSDDQFSYSMENEFESLVNDLDDDDQQTLQSWFKDVDMNNIHAFIMDLTGFTLDLSQKQLYEKASKMSENHISENLLPTYIIEDTKTVSKIVKHLFIFGIDLIIEFIENDLWGYVEDVKEMDHLSDASISGDSHEIMIYCDQYILLDTEQYEDFMYNYHDSE